MPSCTTSPPISSGGGMADSVSFDSSHECRDNPDSVGDTPLEWAEPSRPVLQASIVDHPGVVSLNKGDSTLFDKLKKEHNLAKAIKSNNAKPCAPVGHSSMYRGTLDDQTEGLIGPMHRLLQDLPAKPLVQDEAVDEVKSRGELGEHPKAQGPEGQCRGRGSLRDSLEGKREQLVQVSDGVRATVFPLSTTLPGSGPIRRSRVLHDPRPNNKEEAATAGPR
jgi:hypothetical protein